MPRRPFFNTKLDDLMGIVAERPDDVELLRDVLEELENRRTQAAAALRRDIGAHIERLEAKDIGAAEGECDRTHAVGRSTSRSNGADQIELFGPHQSGETAASRPA